MNAKKALLRSQGNHMNMCVKTNGKYGLQSKLKPGATEAPAIIFIFSNGYEGIKSGYRTIFKKAKGKFVENQTKRKSIIVSQQKFSNF